MKRMPLILAVLITAFVLGVVGSVVKVVSASRETVRAAELEQAMQEQKQAYSQVIAEANDRILQANEVIKEISVKNQQDAETKEAEHKISLDKAVSLALSAVGLNGSSVSGHAELVDYNGSVAYEVQLDGGEKVYLDAEEGKILYNSLTGGPSAVIDDKLALVEAVNYMQGGLVTSVEKTKYNEVAAFLVTFSTGDQVYVSLAGEVLALVQPQYFYTGSTASVDNSSVKPSKKSARSDDDHEDESDDD